MGYPVRGHRPVTKKPGSLSGLVGRIDWHYYPAAGIEGYTVTRDRQGQWALRATVILANTYNMAHPRELVFVAKTRHKMRFIEWRWPILSFSYRDADHHVLVASLGPPSATI